MAARWGGPALVGGGGAGWGGGTGVGVAVQVAASLSFTALLTLSLSPPGIFKNVEGETCVSSLPYKKTLFLSERRPRTHVPLTG